MQDYLQLGIKNIYSFKNKTILGEILVLELIYRVSLKGNHEDCPR